ncbi:hypothetical protein [Bradyrhizobium uaiense]|uniref:Bacteriophage SP-beta YorD domain-containing protein n=1 Tax=Bradyrhizobium uaiense TaxID=2594946 RepID=A0A6P1B965_9BRAD|nr:hypothetical protein [Bradyrhizobium uaiense]NEU94814.1 hypothetical protein [Bradyrhizobium uaiense]
MAFQPEQFVAAVQSLRPGLMPRVDFDVSNDGSGPVISGWYRADVAQPTQAQIEAVDTDALKAPESVLPQDLMAQFTADDMGKIQTAIASSPANSLLWYAMVAQRDPMWVTNARFLAGWTALVNILGSPRMSQIASALNVTV